MSDEIEWFQDLLRRDPDAPHLRLIIRRLKRFEEARGKTPLPPARRLDDARRILLTKDLIAGVHDLKRKPVLPIDFLMRQLINDSTIIENVDIDPFREARQAIIDGCTWGDYYARHKLGRQPGQRARAKMVREDARTLISGLDEFLAEHGADIDMVVVAATGHDRHTGKYAAAVRAARDALTEASQHAEEVISNGKGGSPGNPWRVGFVWGMGLGWRGLTGRKVSPSSRKFMRFVEDGFKSLSPDELTNSDDWTSAVRTAVSRFGAGEKCAWEKRPGDEGT